MCTNLLGSGWRRETLRKLSYVCSLHIETHVFMYYIIYWFIFLARLLLRFIVWRNSLHITWCQVMSTGPRQLLINQMMLSLRWAQRVDWSILNGVRLFWRVWRACWCVFRPVLTAYQAEYVESAYVCNFQPRTRLKLSCCSLCVAVFRSCCYILLWFSAFKGGQHCVNA